jgi:dynein heavy chain
MISLGILMQSGKISSADINLFLRGGSGLDTKSEPPNPYAKWMSDKVWLNVLALERHVSFVSVLGSLSVDIGKSETEWKRWFDNNEPESSVLPGGLENSINAVGGDIKNFLKTVLVRCLREDRTTIVSEQFIGDAIGEKFTKPVTDSIESIWLESTCRKPILYLLSAGSDPTMMIDEIAKKKKRFPTDKVSMGEGQEIIALDKIKAGFLTGNWVILQNSHLGLGFMERLEDLISKTADIDTDFRLWITCEVTDKFPIGLLQMSIKVTLEPPMGIQAGLSRTYSTSVSQELLDRVDHEVWRKLVYVIAYMHSIVQERRKFGPIGWCVPYEFNSSDMEASLLFLEKHLSSTVLVGQPLSWSTIQYMVSEVQYGGRITDDMDRELFNTYANRWLCEQALKPGFSFLGPTPVITDMAATDGYSLPTDEGFDIAIYKSFIEKIPNVDSPSIFGLHKNADLTYRQLEASMLLSTIAETQPKDGSASSSGGGVQKSRDEIVKDKAKELLSRMPKDFIDDQVRVQVGKHKGPPGTSDKGFQAPLNIFMFQEIQRIQRVIGIVRTNLSSLVMAIDGTVVMTPELMDDLNMIYDARIPRSWTHDASGAEISWLTPSLGSWFTGLLDRVNQLTTWLDNGRQAMKGYWLTGFLNPQGFLTAVRQEVTRQHKKDSWALDDVVTHTEVIGYDIEKVRDVPDEGQNIYGLFLEGAKWNRFEGRLDESDPKKLFSQMPVIHVTAVTAKEKKAKTGGDYGPHGPYECPVYKYPKRTDKYLIFRMNLKTQENPDHWKLRGVAMLCSTE